MTQYFTWQIDASRSTNIILKGDVKIINEKGKLYAISHLLYLLLLFF